MSITSSDPIVDDICASVVYCQSCHHRDDVHDTTARRYCAATLNGSMDRGCICRGDLSDMNPNQHPNSTAQ